MATPQQLFSSLFTPATVEKEIPRLAISLDGMDKCGKTYYALMTTPDPIAVITNDTGTEVILQQALKRGRKIAGKLTLDYVSPDPKVIKKEDVDREQQKIWREQWALYLNGMRSLVYEKKVRTVVVDNHTNIYELGQLAKFGKVVGNKDNQSVWAELYREMHTAFWGLYKGRPDVNIVLIHKAKKEYKAGSDGKDKWTGKYERSGYRDVGFWVDVSLQCGWDGVMRQFYTQVDPEQSVRFNPPAVVGKKWAGADSTFANLGMDTFPETELTPEVWGL